MKDDELRRQAGIFARYLLGVEADDATVELYITAIKTTDMYVPKADAALLAFALKHHWSLGFLESGAAFIRPRTELRRRLFIVLSILETRPALADDYFLPQKHGFWRVVGVGLTAIKAGCKVAVGMVLIKVVAR